MHMSRKFFAYDLTGYTYSRINFRVMFISKIYPSKHLLVLKTSSKTKNAYAEDVLKTS